MFRGRHITMDKEILKAKELSLPIMYSEGTCEQVLLKCLEDYFELLYSNKWGTVSTREKINNFNKSVKKMFEEYYLGHQNKAYQYFKKALLYDTDGTGLITSVLPKESLYRARNNKGIQDYNNNEMFHIKYDSRGKVKTQRFSFPGLPCLYLGGSSYVCWLELNRPSFDQFQVATIRQNDIRKDLKVIDLSIHPLSFYNELNNSSNEIKTNHPNLSVDDYLRWWPIMACCSVAAKNEEDPFKPEYIFPQFMLQYLLEEEDEIVGIKYISIKAGRVSMKQYETNYRTYTNYVIPSRNLNTTENGFCKTLSSQFSIFKNISGKELQVVSDMVRESGVIWHGISDQETDESLDSAVIYGSNNTSYAYEKSIFRRIEKILDTDDKTIDKMIKDSSFYMGSISDSSIKDLF